MDYDALGKIIASLRSSERGLKLPEILYGKSDTQVAPFVGAWIEIRKTVADTGAKLSLRSSERGLKFVGRLKSF